MERTLISWNVPNLITVPLMAALGFLIVAVAAQLFMQFTGNNGGGTANNAGGF